MFSINLLIHVKLEGLFGIITALVHLRISKHGFVFCVLGDIPQL